jgi:hypothetical protein
MRRFMSVGSTRRTRPGLFRMTVCTAALGLMASLGAPASASETPATDGSSVVVATDTASQPVGLAPDTASPAPSTSDPSVAAPTGTGPAPEFPTSLYTVGVASAGPAGDGYWTVADSGEVIAQREASDDPLPGWYGDPRNAMAFPAVGIVSHPNGGGYWIASADGGVFNYGSAGFYGSLPGLNIHVSNIVGIAGTANGQGYWLVGSDGAVYAFGNAPYYGRPTGNTIVGVAATASGQGYWLAATNGAIYAYGNAPWQGNASVSNIVGIAGTSNGQGYWLAGADGATYAFGNAQYHGNGTNCCGFPFSSIVAKRGLHDGGYRIHSKNDGNFPSLEEDKTPIGNGEANDYSHVAGWAVDPNTTTRSVTIVVRTTDGIERYRQTTPGYRFDVNNAYAGISGNHGFDWPIATIAPALLDAQPHTVQVWALDTDGVSSLDHLLRQDTWTSPVQTPGVPQNVIATSNEDDSATVTWTAPASNGGATIDQYAVNAFYASNGAFTGQQVVVCGTCTSATITGLTVGTSYYFGAYAHNLAGYGAPGISNTITIANVAPIGVVERADGSKISGWVHDPNNRSQPLNVNIYIDGALKATVTANLSRPNNNPALSDRFEWAVPTTYRDGHQHTVAVKALDYPANTESIIGNPTLDFAQLDDTWTGADGSSWDTNKWITSIGGGGGVFSAVDISGNQGRLFVKGGDAMAIANNPAGSVPPMRDAEALFTYRFDSRTASSTFRTIARGSGAWPVNSGYRLNVTSDSQVITVERVSGGSATSLGSFTYTKDTNPQQARFRVEGGRVRVKVWPAAGAEPLAWQLDVTDGSPLPGSGTLQFQHTLSKGTRSVFVDGLSLIRLEASNEPNPQGTMLPNSISRYIEGGPTSDTMSAGKADATAAGASNFDPLVVLDYFAQNGLNGATGGSRPLTDTEVISLTTNYIDGYYSINSGHELAIALGTNTSLLHNENEARNKGSHWAALVATVLTAENGHHPNITVAGAIDVESGGQFAGPAPAGPANTKAWTAGFDSNAGEDVNGFTVVYLNFGSADMCPIAGTANQNTPLQCKPFNTADATQNWTQDDYWQITNGPAKTSKGLPEIYHSDWDDQWFRIAIYGFNAFQKSTDFWGSFTEHASDSRTNTADISYPELKNTLNNDPRTSQPLGYSTDIKHGI